MVFSSAVFLFLFLPVVIILHTAIKNNKLKNGMLIAASLIFYAFGEPYCIALLVASVAVNYFFGLLLSKRKNRILLGIAVSLNLAMLVFFKYTGLVKMPIGISFFTFQAISYIVDVYRSEKNEKNSFSDVLLYISLFPQLIAGPIVKYNSIKDRIKERFVTVDGMTRGIRQFIVGLSKKMLIANTMAVVADSVFSSETGALGAASAWLGAIAYTLQIYFDFSGYSDMALGLGKMLGFDFPENFNYPYIASSVRDFWRRWHMSLTSWFREYLYIPLGGNKKGRARKLLNTMIVFACTGIWHGANWTFLVWGVFHGVIMCVEELVVRKKENTKFNIFGWLYTAITVVIGFVIFRADSLTYAVGYIGKMFSFSNPDNASAQVLSMLTPVFIATFVIAVIASTPLIKKLAQRSRVLNTVSYAASFGLLLLCIMSLAAESYNPFIYFRF